MKKINGYTITILMLCFIVFILATLSGTEIMAFSSISSLGITLLGSFIAVLLSYSLEDLLSALKNIGYIFCDVKEDKSKIVATFVKFSRESRKKGMLAIEDSIEELENQTMKKGLTMVLLNQPTAKIRKVIRNDIQKAYDENTKKISIFKSWANFAPAFGMFGTIVGMVQIFSNMSSNDAAVGGFGKAFLTTLYGLLLANLIFNPVATKLTQQRDEEERLGEMILEGVVDIKNEVNNRIIRENLFGYLDKKEMEKYFKAVQDIKKIA